MNHDNQLNHQVYINQKLTDINELLTARSADEAYLQYTELVAYIEIDKNDVDSGIKAGVYASFANFLFSVSEYVQFFRMLMKAQHYGHSGDEIEKMLLEAFIEPNLEEFKTIYESNLQFLISKQYIHNTNPLTFEELPYWLLPTEEENHYFMYDKQQKLIKDAITLYSYQEIQSLPLADAFSDYVLHEDWNLDIILTCTNVIRKMNKKSFIIINDMGKFLSSIQGALLNDSILSNVYIFDQLASFQDYFTRTGAYLPRNAINLVDQSQILQNILAEIHHYRLKKENRKGDRVLLSICIPTYNRGNRAYDNVIHTLNSYYDEEIEIVVSNNATQNETKEYYDRISEIKDARLTYHRTEENLGFPLNLCQVSELAHGKFILLISDEDLVNFDVLDKVMHILNTSKNTLAMLRTSTSSFYQFPDKAAPAGRDAFANFMLISNYMSGMILNNEFLKQHKGIDYLKENLASNPMIYWYPHMFWEIFLCQYGEMRSTRHILINEGPNEHHKVKYDIHDDIPDNMAFRRLASRFEQHKGTYCIFKDLEICKSDSDLLRDLYLQQCKKTFHLVNLSIALYYNKAGRDCLEILKQTYDFCLRDEFNPKDSPRYLDDIKVITDIYNVYFKHVAINYVYSNKQAIQP